MTTTVAAKKNGDVVSDPKRDSEAVERLVLSRISLLMKQPFFGNIATRMTIKNANEWCDTCATDGRHFYYNTEFVLKLQQRELDFVFGHEVLHACYDHVGRFEGRILEIANIAADYVVNADLVDQNIGVKPTTVPVLYDHKYFGWSFEQVYDDLMKNVKTITMSELSKMLLDDHLNGDGDGDGEDGEGDGSGRPKFSPSELQQIKDEIKEAMLSAAQAVGAGNTPAGVQRMLKDLTEPKMNWKELLQQQIESCVKTDFTWMKPSRRGWHCDAIMPGMRNGDALNIAVAIDTSGSISSEMLNDFLSEVHGIMQQFTEYKIDIWCFDVAVHNPQQFSHDSGDDLLTYKVTGGGGTAFSVNWQYMKDVDLVPKKLVFFTDMDSFDGYGDPDYCDVIWIVHNPYWKGEAPHGIAVTYG